MNEHFDNSDSPTEAMMRVGLMLVTMMILGLVMLLVCFSILRESRAFWTNAGGYPVWLRDLVYWCYLPLFAGIGICLLALSAACFSKIFGAFRYFVGELLILLLCWGLLAMSGCIAFKNNIENLIEGRELHHHDNQLP